MMGFEAVEGSALSLESALGVVSRQGWFSERSPQTRARLAKLAKLQHIAKNDLVFMAGDKPNGIFGLVSGSLNISIPRGDGEDYMIHRAASGFWIGDLDLFGGDRRIFSVRPAEPAVMVHISASDLQAAVARDPSLFADFYVLCCENASILVQIISNLAIPSSEKRLADRLLMELETRGDKDGWIPASQSELATLSAMSLPTWRRGLQRFASANLIEQRYGNIRVLDADVLRKIRGG